MADGFFETLEGYFAVEFVDLTLDPSEILVFAIDFDENFWTVFGGAEGSEQFCLVRKGGVSCR